MAIKVEELQTIISANADQFHSELTKIQSTLGNLEKNTNRFNNSIGSKLTKSFITAQVVTNVFNRSLGFLDRTIRDSIGTTQQYESALIGLETVAGRKLGMEAIPQATRAAKELSEDGLMSVQDSALGLKNLLASGFSLPEAINLMNTFKNSAAFGRQASLGFGESITSATEGIKNGNSILVDNAGITKNLSNILVEAGYSQQDLNKATSDAGIRQALYNGLLKEGNLFQGDAARLANTTQGQLASLGVTLTNIKVTLGNFIKPIQSVVQTSLLAFFGGVQSTLNGAESSIRSFSYKVAGYFLAIVRVVGTLLSRLPGIGKNFESLANLSLKTSSAQNNLGGALVDTGNNLDATTSSADKLKKSLLGLASFDEMNILSKPDSGSGSSGGTADSGIGGFDTGAVGGGGAIDNAGIESINKTADEIIGKFNGIKETVKNLFGPLLENPIVQFLLDVAKGVGILFLGFRLISPIIGVLIGGFGNLTGIIEGVKVVLGVIATIFGTTVGPVLIVIGVIAALVAGFYLLYTNSESFRNSIDQLVSGALTWIQKNIVPVFDSFMIKVNELVAVFQEKWPAIQAAIQPLIDSIATFLVGALKLLGQIIDWLWINILKPLVDFILANIVPAFSIAIDIVTKIIEIFSALASKIIDLIVPILTFLWETFTKVFEAIRSIVSFVWDNILKPILQALWDLISKLIVPVIQNLLNIFSIVFNKIREIAENVWAGIMQAIQPVINWINDNIMPVINRFKEQFEGVWNGIKTTVENIWNGIQNSIKGAINGVIDIINGFIRHVNDLIQSVSDVASAIPGGSKIDFRIGYIQKLARGGVIDSPTFAMLGEAGKEAVVPLENNTGWIDMIADKLNGAGGEKQPIVIKVGEDTIYEGFIDYHNQKSLESGSPLLNI